MVTPDARTRVTLKSHTFVAAPSFNQSNTKQELRPLFPTDGRHISTQPLS